MRYTIETERETDGRWIAEIPQIPGALQYGKTKNQAIARAKSLALRIAAERTDKAQRDSR